MNNQIGSILLPVSLFSLGFLFTSNYYNKQNKITLQDLKNKKTEIKTIEYFYNNNSIITTINGENYILSSPSYDNLEKNLDKYDIDVPLTYHPPGFIDNLVAWSPFLLLGGLFLLMNRRSLNNELFKVDIGKSMKNNKEITTRFTDIIGQDHAKNIVKEYVDILANPQKYSDIGAKTPKGVLLSGPPGTGKTLMAKAVAGESNLPFISISGSELTSMFVGAAAFKVKGLYEDAGKLADEHNGCVVFIDEIDAIGSKRNSGFNYSGNTERENTLNQLLTQLDGFGEKRNILTFAATNRPEILDPALTRSGRFDRKIGLDLPTLKDRELIFGHYIDKIAFGENSGNMLEQLAKLTPGLSPADISNICNEGAIIGARHNKQVVEENDILEAIDSITLGPIKDIVLDDKTRETVAYHEAGHCVVSYLLSEIGNPIKVSIIAREKALGFSQSEDEGVILKGKKELLQTIQVLMAGRIAEEIFMGDVTVGAISDIDRATKIANDLVKRYGMGELPFHNLERSEDRWGNHIYNIGDDDLNRIIFDQYTITKSLMMRYKDEITQIKNLLLQHDTIYGEVVANILDKRLFNK